MLPLYVNGRFRNRLVSGVERYAGEALRHFSWPYGLLEPPKAASGLAGHVWEQLALPRLVRGGVLWSPANTGPLAVPAQALTIHDPGPLDHPEWYHPLFAAWYRWLWPRLAARVGTVLAVSDFSRRRIEACLGVPAGRIRVIPGGVDVSRFNPRSGSEIAAIRSRYGLASRFVLFVGTVQPRKNLAGLAQAMEFLAADFPEVELVVAGDTGRPFARHDLPAEQAGAIRFLGRVLDSDLPALYSAAEAFVQPSFYEGGGLTVLEAMACGTPVAAARGSALEETLGDAGAGFDPHDPAEIAKTVGGLLGDVDLQARLREAGLERVREYSWTRGALSIEAALAAIPLPASP